MREQTKKIDISEETSGESDGSKAEEERRPHDAVISFRPGYSAVPTSAAAAVDFGDQEVVVVVVALVRMNPFETCSACHRSELHFASDSSHNAAEPFERRDGLRPPAAGTASAVAEAATAVAAAGADLQTAAAVAPAVPGSDTWPAD